MKLPILWGLSIAWAALFYWMAKDQFHQSWAAEGSIFNLLTASDKLRAFLAGIGAVAVGSFPPLCCYLIHRFHKSRERGRLVKERDRINRRIEPAVD
jgi:hypothetical protein